MLCKNIFKFRKYPSLNIHNFSFQPFSESNDPNQQTAQQGEQSKRSMYDLKVAQDYVKENIRKFDWATYCAANYFPSKLRSDYYAIYWFYHELTRAVENTRETSLGLGKIDFWEDSIEKIFQDKPIKEPISICLHEACKNSPIPKGLLLRLINAKKYEINTPECPDLAAFETVSEYNRATLLYIILKMIHQDINNPAIQHVAEHAGTRRQDELRKYIKKVPFTLRRYKLYLPEDVLRKHNVSVRNLWNRIEGKPKEELFDVILEVAAHAKKHLEVAREGIKDLPPNAFRAFLQCVEANYFLERLEKVNFDIFDRSLHVPGYTTVPYRIFMAARKQSF